MVQVEEAQALLIKNGELENRVRELSKSLENAREEVSTGRGGGGLRCSAQGAQRGRRLGRVP